MSPGPTVPGAGRQHRGARTAAVEATRPSLDARSIGKAPATVDVAAADVDPGELDALVIPGGYSPDHLRMDRDVVSFVRHFAVSGKLVAAVCHGPQLLIGGDVVRGRTMPAATSPVT